MSRTDNSLRNMVTGLLGQAITLVLQFVYRTIFIQTLGVTYLSVNGLFTNILSIFSFAELGIGQAIIYSLYKPIKDNDVPKMQALMNLYRKTYTVIGCVILTLGFAFIPFLPVLLQGSADGVEHLHLIYILFVIESGCSYFFSYRQSFLSACQKQYVLNLTGAVLAAIREVFRISLILIFRRFIPVLLFNVAFNLVQNGYYAWKIGRMYPFLRDARGKKLEQGEKKTIFQNVRALIIYKLGNKVLSSTDNIIITTVAGLNWVGLYSNYLVLETSVSAFISVLFSSLTASIGNLNAGDDVDQKYRIFKVTNLATFWFYAIASVCFLVALTPTIIWWIGEEWVLGFPTVAMICLNIYVGGMLYTPYNYRQTMGLFVYGKWRPFISAVINLVVSIVLGKLWGLTGVLAGTVIARLTTNAWFDPYIVHKKGFGRSPAGYFVQYWLLMGLLLVSAGIGLLIAKIFVFGGLFDILLHCVLCVVVLSALYTLIFHRTEEFRYLKTVAVRYICRFTEKWKRKEVRR